MEKYWVVPLLVNRNRTAQHAWRRGPASL